MVVTVRLPEIPHSLMVLFYHDRHPVFMKNHKDLLEVVTVYVTVCRIRDVVPLGIVLFGFVATVGRLRITHGVPTVR